MATKLSRRQESKSQKSKPELERISAAEGLLDSYYGAAQMSGKVAMYGRYEGAVEALRRLGYEVDRSGTRHRVTRHVIA